MKRHPRAKRDRILLQKLIYIMLIAAACSFIIGVFWPASDPAHQMIRETDAKPQTSIIIPSPNAIASHPASKAVGESELFSTEPNRQRIKIAKAHVLFPEKTQENSVGGAKEYELLPATPKPDVTIQPENLNLEIPQDRVEISEDRVTPSLEGVQELQVEPESKEIPEWERQPETFSAPTEFRAKIVKNVIPLGQEKVIALTFDDGPSRHNTLRVLDILKKKNIKATFFWVGQNLKAYPKIGKQVVAEGHAIGNHTWHHWYHHMDRSTAAREIDDTAELIYKTTGITTSLFRPPAGILNNGVADYAKTKNYVVAMWSVDPIDYRQRSAQQLINTVIQKAQPGAIVLMHDGGSNHSATVEALPQIITKLQELGYRFVTVPELLEMKEPQQLERLGYRG